MPNKGILVSNILKGGDEKCVYRLLFFQYKLKYRYYRFIKIGFMLNKH